MATPPFDPAAAMRRVRPPMIWCALVLTAQLAWTATAAGLGRVEGRVIAADSGEPISFADVLLVPADTTLRRVGGLRDTVTDATDAAVRSGRATGFTFDEFYLPSEGASPNFARSEQIRRSHASVSSRPPPRQAPEIAATTG